MDTGAWAIRATRDYLQGKVEDVEGRLREARGERRESQRDRLVAEAVTLLQSSVAGDLSLMLHWLEGLAPGHGRGSAFCLVI